MEFLSPAKVNLHLEVLDKREDGYHHIQTLMHRIDLCDRLEIREGGRGIRLISEGEGAPGGMENLASRAARLFCLENIIPENLEIRIRKAIPVGAGLGGGSSNAAATLVALNELFRTGRDKNFLMGLGARLGADVPFFIYERPALARGIGETLTPVRVPSGLCFLLLIPIFRISTAWAYESYDRLAGEKKQGSPLPDSYPDLKSLLRVMKNDLELPAFASHPEIARMKERLLKGGAKGALMSGSGSVIFGLFENADEARRVEGQIPLPPGWKTVITRGI
jgi:4-diphosphocytidyl-2-C-methyl-D-erythritol kinase